MNFPRSFAPKIEAPLLHSLISDLGGGGVQMRQSKHFLLFLVFVVIAAGFATHHFYGKHLVGKHTFANRSKKVAKQEVFKTSVNSSGLMPNKETTITFKELTNSMAKTQQNEFKPGFEWIKPLALSMNIDLLTAKQFQDEALQKLAGGSLQAEDVEEFIRQRLDNFELANDNSVIPETESDWIAQNTLSN